MEKNKIVEIVFNVLSGICKKNNINCVINKDTPLIGSNSVLDSLGLVNLIVDIETEFLDEDIEISLTSENAMSSRISPFRTTGSLVNYIEKQIQ